MFTILFRPFYFLAHLDLMKVIPVTYLMKVIPVTYLMKVIQKSVVCTKLDIYIFVTTFE